MTNIQESHDDIMNNILERAKYLPGEKIVGFDFFGVEVYNGYNDCQLLKFFSNKFDAELYVNHIGEWFESLINNNFKLESNFLSNLLNFNEKHNHTSVCTILYLDYILDNRSSSSISVDIYVKMLNEIKMMFGKKISNSTYFAMAYKIAENIEQLIIDNPDIKDPTPKLNDRIINLLACSGVSLLNLTTKNISEGKLINVQILFMIIHCIISIIKERIENIDIKTKKLKSYISPDMFFFYNCTDYGLNARNAKNANTQFRNDILKSWIKIKIKTDIENKNDKLIDLFIEQFTLSKLSPSTQKDADEYNKKRKTLLKLFKQLTSEIDAQQMTT